MKKVLYCENAREVIDELDRIFREKKGEQTITRPVLSSHIEPANVQINPVCGPIAFAQITLPYIHKTNPLWNIQAEDFESYPVSLFHIAKRLQVTTKGEMYDPRDFKRIGNAIGLKVKVEEKFSFEAYKDTIKKYIKESSDTYYRTNVMVTADISSDEKMPVCREGRRSHWIVIIGYCKIDRTTHVITTDGHPGIKIFPLRQLWNSTKQLEISRVYGRRNLLARKIVTIERAYKDIKDRIVRWELDSPIPRASAKEKREYIHARMLQKLIFLLHKAEIPIDYIREMEHIPSSSKWYHEIQYHLARAYHTSQRPLDAMRCYKQIPQRHGKYNKARNWLDKIELPTRKAYYEAPERIKGCNIL